MVSRNETKLDFGVGDLGYAPNLDKRTAEERVMDNALFKIFCEGLFVQKDIGIVEFLVEPVLHLLHTADDTREVTVPCENDEGRVCLATDVDLWTRTGVVFSWNWGKIRSIICCADDLFFNGGQGGSSSVAFVGEAYDVVQAYLRKWWLV